MSLTAFQLAQRAADLLDAARRLEAIGSPTAAQFAQCRRIDAAVDLMRADELWGIRR